MPLKFLSFPFLVQESILKNMEFFEVFIMSTLSERTKRSAILARIEVPKLRLDVREKEQSIMIRGEKSKTIIKILEIPRLRLRRMWKMNIGNFEFPTKISVTEGKKPSYAQYCLVKVTRIDETFLAAFNLYFKTLFRLKESTKLRMEFIKSAVRTPMFGNVNEAALSGETLTMDDLNSFLTLYPNLNVLAIKQSVNGKLNKKSRMLKVQNVWLSNAGQFGMNLLTKFTGQNICLIKVNFVESDLNEIIRKWINSEGYQNLVSVFVQMDFHSGRFIQTDQVFDQLPVEWFNPMERQEHVEYITRVFGGTLYIDFYGDNCYDVIRKSDGKKASIRADFLCFRMVVWN